MAAVGVPRVLLCCIHRRSGTEDTSYRIAKTLGDHWQGFTGVEKLISTGWQLTYSFGRSETEKKLQKWVKYADSSEWAGTSHLKWSGRWGSYQQRESWGRTIRAKKIKINTKSCWHLKAQDQDQKKKEELFVSWQLTFYLLLYLLKNVLLKRSILSRLRRWRYVCNFFTV